MRMRDNILLCLISILCAGLFVVEVSANTGSSSAQKGKDFRKKVGRELKGVNVHWNRSRGVPSLVTSSNLLRSAGLSLASANSEREIREAAVRVMEGLAPLYGLAEARSSLSVKNVVSDKIGYRHVRLQQSYKGVPVVGGGTIVHFDAKGDCRAVNGNISPDLSIDVTPRLRAEEAGMVALKYSRKRGDPAGTVEGLPRLIVWARDHSPFLAYEVEVSFEDPAGGRAQWFCIVNAKRGNIELSYNNRQNASIAPPGNNGMHEVITGSILEGEGGSTNSFIGWHDYDSAAWYMWNKTNTWYIHNSSVYNSSNWPDAGTYCFRRSNDWGTSDRAAFSLAVNFETILDYHRNVLGRDSYDDAGAMAVANVHYGDDYVNAYWDSGTQEFYFGDGDGGSGEEDAKANELTVLDITAHEFQHAVTEHTADLIYQGESGALNESMSDVFGALVEFYGQPDWRTNYPNVSPGTADWLIGEDCWLEGRALRDMRNPGSEITLVKANRQPSRYKGKLWISAADPTDNGGVHNNSGVHNFFFYLLCDGGVGDNDGISYVVHGIGLDAAAHIAFLTLSGYMLDSTDFPAARDAWIAAAQESDLSGFTTNTVLSVMKAWAAVGIGTLDELEPFDPFITVGEFGIAPYLPGSKTYTMANNQTSSVTWQVTATQPWLSVSPSDFVIAPLAFANITVSVVDSVAVGMDEATYRDIISFYNVTTGKVMHTRPVYLKIAPNYSMYSAPFNWIDPVESGHSRVFMSDGVSGDELLNFDFSFYGNSNYASFNISSRGYVTFLSEGGNVGENTEMPYLDMPNAVAAPYWDNLVTMHDSAIYVGVSGVSPERYKVITWLNMAHADDTSSRFSFQMLINQSLSVSNNNDIIFQYLDVGRSSEFGFGHSATIGMKDEEGLMSRKYSYNGETDLNNEQALLFMMEKNADVSPPTGVVKVEESLSLESGSYSTFRSNVVMEIRFNEIVTGLEISDLELGGNIATATLASLTGSGERYVVKIDGVEGHGFITLGVKAGAVEDAAGHPNAAIEPGLYVLSLAATVFSDDMESGSEFWALSTGDYPGVTYDGWEFGSPGYWFGPDSAYSGSNCWGTVLGSSYPGNMDAWVESCPINVGDYPALEFKVWYDIESDYDRGYVEVNNGSGWINVSPDGYYAGWRDWWETSHIDLDPSQFGNRQISVRFRMTSDSDVEYAGLYIDDVRVVNQNKAGLWVYAYTPTNAVADSISSVRFEIYNSDTQTYHNVSAAVGSLSAGLSLNGTVRYGDVAPGTVVAGSLLTAVFAEAGEFNDSVAKISHAITTGEGILGEEYLTIEVAGVTSTEGTNLLRATTSGSVVDWTGVALSGDGHSGSSLFQLIFAGADGVPNVPTSGGGAGGDDVLLFAMDNITPYGLFGSGDLTPANVGRFDQTFRHGLGSNDLVYVRAWNGASFSTSIAYGDSDTVAIIGTGDETDDFGSWEVDTPIDMERDLNGDTIPDGYDVINGRDAAQAVAALNAEWTSVAIAGTGVAGSGTNEMNSPRRVVAGSNFVFVVDTGNNRIQVLNSNLSSVVSIFSGSGEFVLKDPEGLALDEANNRLVVADTDNNRIVILNLDPATGVLTAGSHFGKYGTSTYDAEFSRPCGVAVDSVGNIYVADTRNHRIKKLSSSGAYIKTFGTAGAANGQFNCPKGICVDKNGLIYVADANHRVQVFNNSGTYVTKFGTQGSDVGRFETPCGIQLGANGGPVVADTANHRVQLFSSNLVALAAYKPPVGEQGSEPGQLERPQGIWSVPDGRHIYVADTGNNRVQLLEMILDLDGDGMNDVWEDENGLDSSDPSDGIADADGDGLSNVGEYRAGTDPSKRDTDGDYAGDLWEMHNNYDPLVFDYDGVFITSFGLLSDHIVQWSVVSGGVYRVEGSVNLANPVWGVLTTVTSSFNGLKSWTNTPAPAEKSYYYRVIKE